MNASHMRVLHRDAKHGEIKLLIQNLDDLWHIDNLVQPGDMVRAMAFRREEQKADKIRPERMEKTRMKLGIRVQKVEFHEFADHLRVSGVIEEGAQDHGAHHTLNLTIGDDIEIVKDWRDSELKRIDDAVAATHAPLISFLAMDDDEATLAEMRQYGLREIATMRSPGHGKMFPTADAKETYFAEILAKVKQSELGENLIVLGPGFARDDFVSFLRQKEPTIVQRTRSYSTGHAGMQGVQEALKSGLGVRILEETRVAQETRAVESLFAEIGRDGLFAYGPASVESAVASGAVMVLLVVENRLRSKEVEELLRRVERQGGKVVVISGHHEAGRRFESLGGFGAILRFKVG